MADTAGDDLLTPSAPQDVANVILGPCVIGWILQVFLGGMATAMAGSLLLNKNAKVGRYSRPLLWISTTLNLASIGVSTAEIWSYMLDQDRSTAKLDAYILADVIAPLFQGLTASACQTFMAIRCAKVSQKAVLVSPVLGVGIASSLAGAVWLTYCNFQYMQNVTGPEALLAPTELWLWSAVVTDIALTLLLSWSLRKMKRGFNRSTDEFISALIKLAFGTCAVPLFFTMFTAVSYASTFQTATLWNMFNASAAAIPSLYLLSFCYCLRQSAASHNRLTDTAFNTARSPQRMSGTLQTASFRVVDNFDLSHSQAIRSLKKDQMLLAQKHPQVPTLQIPPLASRSSKSEQMRSNISLQLKQLEPHLLNVNESSVSIASSYQPESSSSKYDAPPSSAVVPISPAELVRWNTRDAPEIENPAKGETMYGIRVQVESETTVE